MIPAKKTFIKTDSDHRTETICRREAENLMIKYIYPYGGNGAGRAREGKLPRKQPDKK